jgi:16S rRNA (cytosine967-C5)-methyltransferase
MADRSARAVARTALTAWRRRKRFADSIVQQFLAKETLSASDRGFVTELFYGVLRNLTLLDFWIDRLRSGSLDHASRDLLRLGLYQIFLLQTPQHAAVFETVELSSRHNRGLINSILRTALRRHDELRAAAESAPPATRFSHPEFLLRKWEQQFGREATTELCLWNNRPPPVYVRVNELKTTVSEFLGKHSGAFLLPDSERFCGLPDPWLAIENGDAYVQDPSTAIAVELLDPQPNESILDACAAPGGKTAYIAQLMKNSGTLVASDRDSARLNLLRENLDRLSVTNATIVRQDWREKSLSPELRDHKFDRILVDAPCSNTGVMRRRVDVRWRLKPDDFVRMPNEQLEIVRAVLPLLKEGAVLVYSTCSVEPEENDRLIERIVRDFPFLHLAEQKSSLPFRDHLDGAFAAKLLRS